MTCPDGTVITTGDQTSGFAAAAGLKGAQVAAGAEFVATATPQLYPHIATACPSGSVAVAGPAARVSCCCASAAPLPTRSAEATSAALMSIDSKVLDRIAVPSCYMDSSITNSRESTSIIISIPPGKML